MKRSELIDFFNTIENQFPVNKWILDDIHIWPLIRIALMFKIVRVESEQNNRQLTNNLFSKSIQPVKKTLDIIKGIEKYSRSYISDYNKNSHLKGKYDVCFLNHSRCRRQINNSWYDVLCDPYIQKLNKLGISSFVLERVPNNEYHIPRYNSSLFIQPEIDYLLIKTKIVNKLNNYDVAKLEYFDEFTKYIETLNITTKNNLINIVQNSVTFTRLLAKYFKKLLTTINPSLCLMVCYYSREGMAFNLACKELGIISVDIQHGIQGDIHPAYGRWNSVPLKGYELLPSTFWCWSEYEANTINKWNHKCSQYHQPIVGGNLFLNSFQKTNSVDDIFIESEKKVLQLKNSKPNSIHILYTLQPLHTIPLQEWIFQAIKDSPSSWFWWIRLHPGMMNDREKIRELFTPLKLNNIFIDQPTDLPLNILLRHSDIHITQSSSTIIEAEHFGVPSVFTSLIAAEAFPLQIASGVAIPAYTHHDLIEAIKIQLLKKGQLEQRQKEITVTKDNALKYLIEQAKIDR